jgi:hypothetical protein
LESEFEALLRSAEELFLFQQSKVEPFTRLWQLEHALDSYWTASYFRAGTSAGVIGGKK